MALSPTKQTEPAKSYEHVTSVIAHIVKAISVQMSVTEMDALIESFGKPDYELTETQHAIQREFADAIYRVR